MQLIKDKAYLRQKINALKSAGKTIAFVPTMGNLHAGHMALVNHAKTLADVVVVSIFVNPLQFGENEDFSEYPRTPAEDNHQLEAAQVDILFEPEAQDIYGDNLRGSTKVEVTGISDILCGKFRPDFFVGVATIVAKLFNLVMPDVAVFGRKDIQQLHVVKRMVEELYFPIKIVAVDTIREEKGLAISSRNRYLNKSERQMAGQIYKSLIKAKADFLSGVSVDEIERKYKKYLENNEFKLDYFVIRDSENLSEPESAKTVVIMTAAWMGTTRLIDNIIVEQN